VRIGFPFHNPALGYWKAVLTQRWVMSSIIFGNFYRASFQRLGRAGKERRQVLNKRVFRLDVESITCRQVFCNNGLRIHRPINERQGERDSFIPP